MCFPSHFQIFIFQKVEYVGINDSEVLYFWFLSFKTFFISQLKVSWQCCHSSGEYKTEQNRSDQTLILRSIKSIILGLLITIPGALICHFYPNSALLWEWRNKYGMIWTSGILLYLLLNFMLQVYSKSTWENFRNPSFPTAYIKCSSMPWEYFYQMILMEMPNLFSQFWIAYQKPIG